MLDFLVAAERYAIEAVYVVEIDPLKDLTQVPGSPAHVAGLINIRGKILTVIDLRKIFDLPNEGPEPDTIITLQVGSVQAGLFAQSVVGLRPIPLDQIQPVLPTLTGIRSEYLRGIGADTTAILNLSTLFSENGILGLESEWDT